MRIVHLSDIHFSKEDIRDFQDFAMPALLDDLEIQNSEKKIDLIFITGDLIDKGGKSFNKIEDAFNQFQKNVIEPIKYKLTLDNDRFFFVPGNHDILKDADSVYIEDGLTSNLKSTEALNNFISSDNVEGIKRILPYKEFEKNFYNNNSLKKNISNFQSSYIIKIDGKTIGINCLNTAWRCYDSKTDKEKILLGERQIIEGHKIIKECDIKIALIHHHLDWLSDFDKESIESFIYKYYDGIFCGHVHRGSSWSTTKSYGDIFISVAPQNWAGNVRNNDRDYSNGYSILDYNMNLGKMFVNYRRYSQKSIGYVTNTDFGKEGRDEFEFKSKANVERRTSCNIDYSLKQDMKAVNIERDNENYFKSGNISNEFMIRKNVYEICFMKHKNIIKDNLEMIAKYSVKYAELMGNLDLIIILLDKLIYRVTLDNNDNEYINIMIELDKYFCKISNNSEEKINVLTLIYNSICWFWSKVTSEVIPGMFNCEITIPNLVDQIVNLEGPECINDQYIKVLIEAKYTNIALYSGNDYELKKNSDISLKCQTILCIVLPAYLYRKTIMDWTSELQIGKFEDIETEQLLESVKDEYLHLQSSYVERNISIELIYKKIINDKITIIKGKSGTGKSSIISKVIERLSMERYGEIFSSAVIIYSFKYSKNIHELVNSIVGQCNSKLVNKIDTKILHEIQTEYNLWSNNQTQLNKNKFNNIYNIYEEIVKEAVNNFIIEHGEVYIFIDSLELVNIYENEIKNLFINLPINSHIVICTSENDETINKLVLGDSIEKNIIEIGYLSLMEISHIMNMPYEDEDNKYIIDKIYELTKGNIRLIKDLFKKANASELDILSFLKNNTIKIEKENIELYNNMANEWILFNTGILEEILLIFSVYESVDFISFEKLQSFLNYKGYNIRLPKIKKYLSKVDRQIIYTSNNKVKLNNKEFAEFVVNKFFSKTDIEKFITDLFDWICKCLEKEYNFTVDFFKCLIKSKLIDELLFKDNLNRFIEQKKENNESQYLFNVGILMLEENKNMTEYSLKMIESAVELNNSDAKGFLGFCLLKGKYIDQNISKGEKLINEACELGNTIAKSILGQMLIKGDCVKRDSERGRKLLFEASSEGNINAKLNLSILLILGQEIKPNPIQGREMLYELIKDNNAGAMLIMGIFMIDGISIERNTDEGLKLINQAIKNGSLEAKLELAERLINGNGIATDETKGIRLLEELIDSGSIEAKRVFARINVIKGDIKKGYQLFEELVRNNDSQSILIYSRLIMDGELPEVNKQKALELLNKEIENNNIDAIRELGLRLLEGEGIEKNTDEGIRLLEDAIRKADVESMRELGYKFANGIDVAQNKERGEALLLTAVERGDATAKALYGLTLMNNYKDKHSKTKVLQLFEEAVSCGNIYAKLCLSNILFEGELTKKDVPKSVGLLEECIISGDTQAARILGYKLIYGIGMPHDIIRAKELLIKAVDNADSLAKTIFGEAIILGYFKEYTVEYGIELLEQASCKEQMAKKVLGTLLIKGINITQNKEKGELLLRCAAENGNITAIRELYNMLLDGRYLDKNIEEGKKYLMKGIELNDNVAKIDLATRLLDGDKLPKDKSRGQQIFEELVNSNNSNAMCEYGKRLILGDGIIKNKLRGEELLKKSVELGNMNAKRYLAMSIIDGEIDTSSKEEAIKLLEENILELDEMTMAIYGGMLIDGDKIEEDKSRGINLLKECSKNKNSIGKYYLGKRLVEGKKLDQDIETGIALLGDASLEGDERAKIYLAEMNICGRYIAKNEDKGIEMLDNLMSNGNEEAQIILANRLIKGDCVKRDKDRGVYLLKELVEKGNTDAMIDYGKMLLDGFYVEMDSAYGRYLLNCAIKNENYYASYIMGKRLLSGKGIRKHKSHGIKELNKAIKHNIISAAFEYGLRQKYGIDVVMDVKEGKSRIENVLVTADIEEKYSLGIIAYNLKDYELAIQLFYDAYTNNIEEASISLAYMYRRNEIKRELHLPDIHKLLEKPIKKKDHNAYINLALYYIKKNEKNQDWGKVDEIFRCLDYCGGAADWWYEISEQGDLEGELVLGLMDRYGLIPGLSKTTFVEIFKKINKNGWNIPNWMFEEIIAHDEVASTKG